MFINKLNLDSDLVNGYSITLHMNNGKMNTISCPDWGIDPEAKDVEVRAIVKCKAGFMTVVDKRDFQTVRGFMTNFLPGVVKTVEVKQGDHFTTVFALKGKNIVTLEANIADALTVSDMRSLSYESLEFETVKEYNKPFPISETQNIAA